jgi:hypothetical protein
MNIYKYRHNSAASYGSWEYIEYPYKIGSPNEVKEFFEYKERDYCDSDLYRGIEYKPVPEVEIPIEWLEKEIKKFANQAKWAKAQEKKYKEMLAKRKTSEVTNGEATT